MPALVPAKRHVRPSPDNCHLLDQDQNAEPVALGQRPPAPAHLASRSPEAKHRWPNQSDPSPHSRSGECHSSQPHKNAQAHQTAFRCWGCDGGSHGRQAPPANTPLFPQSPPTTKFHPSAVSPTGSRPNQVRQPRQVGNKKIGEGLGRY